MICLTDSTFGTFSFGLHIFGEEFLTGVPLADGRKISANVNKVMVRRIKLKRIIFKSVKSRFGDPPVKRTSQ